MKRSVWKQAFRDPSKHPAQSPESNGLGWPVRVDDVIGRLKIVELRLCPPWRACGPEIGVSRSASDCRSNGVIVTLAAPRRPATPLQLDDSSRRTQNLPGSPPPRSTYCARSPDGGAGPRG